MLLFISDYPSLVTISIRVNQRRTHCPQSCLLIFCSVRMSTIIWKCCHIIWQKCCAPDCDQMWRSVSSLRVIPRSCDPDTWQYCHSTILLTSPQPGKMAAVRVMCDILLAASVTGSWIMLPGHGGCCGKVYKQEDGSLHNRAPHWKHVSQCSLCCTLSLSSPAPSILTY